MVVKCFTGAGIGEYSIVADKDKVTNVALSFFFVP